MVTIVSGVQYSGAWSLSSQANAKALGTWPLAASGLWSWGDGSSGQLGLGNRTSYSTPKQVSSAANWGQISFSRSRAGFAVKTDGSLWCWGQNDFGQLGLGNTTYYSSPKQVGALTNWLNVSAGGYLFTVATKTDGTLWSWGYNPDGELGLGNRTNYSSPKQVGALTNWSIVSAGYRFVLAIKTNGTLWAWGYGVGGPLGLGNTTSYSSPKQVGALTNWSIISGGESECAAIKTDGTLWTWGLNDQGQLGLGNINNYSSPVQVGVLTTWSKVSENYRFGLAVKTDGTMWSWGVNGQGQLGLGVQTKYSSPKQVGNLTNWSKPYTGYQFAVAIKTDGTLWSWGQNSSGQLGNGLSSGNVSTPQQVGTSSAWVSAAPGQYAIIAKAA